MPEDIRAVFRDNVRALLELRARENNTKKAGISGLIAMGVANGTAQRILGGETSIGLDVVLRVAEGLEVSPWMLLVPRLNVDSLPGLTEDHSAWPFPLVDQAAYLELTPTERAFVQGGMSRDISEITNKRQAKRAVNGIFV